MGLATDWGRIQAGLPGDWADARLSLTLVTADAAHRAAALLAPLQPGRSERELRFYAARRGAGPSPGAVARGLERLDEEGIVGQLRLLASDEATLADTPAARRTAAAAWDAVLATLPPDWTDLYCEVELTSSDHLEPAALALAPLNPARYGGTPGFRFRCARRFGYGTAPPMVRRCLERLDERGMPAEVRILRALSDSKPAGTQGPVWYVGGRAV